MGMRGEAKKTKRGKKDKKPEIPTFFAPFCLFSSISTFFMRPDFIKVS
jgi:hypothetical protein